MPLAVQVLPENSSSKGDIVPETLQSSSSLIRLHTTSCFSEAAIAAAWENLMALATGPMVVLPSPYADLSFLETLPACDIEEMKAPAGGGCRRRVADLP